MGGQCVGRRLRLNTDAPNRSGMNYLPDSVREALCDETSETTPDGQRWPRPVQVLMQPGDACIAMYNIPHSGSHNENGTESRKNIIFRIRNKSRQPDKVLTGLSDHPDQGWLGEWLEYEEGNDPWERSKHAMCNMWGEWEGIADHCRGTHTGAVTALRRPVEWTLRLPVPHAP
ncbi:MAG: hypothetical protein QF921_16855 [Pseudomonadales bacterium]|nr:hypothetical protein [Pseudomonadales bacterium]MDP6973155.1 hypothetical protein [Pseudomonadales bacterium]